jgi:hypothetical protein
VARYERKPGANVSNDPKDKVIEELQARLALLERRSLEHPLPGMPLDPEEVKRQHAAMTETLQGRHRNTVAKANRAKGFPQPKVGDTFYGWLRKSVRSGVRSREGINFEPGQNVTIKVVADEEGDTRDVRPVRLAGTSTVTVDGMERIFEDDTLVINRDPTAIVTDDIATLDAAGLRAAQEAAAARSAAAGKRLAELEAEARRNAPDPGDGRPSRLPAAAKARAGAAEPKEPDKG